MRNGVFGGCETHRALKLGSKPAVEGGRAAPSLRHRHIPRAHRQLLGEIKAMVHNFLVLRTSPMFSTPTFDDFGRALQKGSEMRELRKRLHFQSGLGR